MSQWNLVTNFTQVPLMLTDAVLPWADQRDLIYLLKFISSHFKFLFFFDFLCHFLHFHRIKPF